MSGIAYIGWMAVLGWTALLLHHDGRLDRSYTCLLLVAAICFSVARLRVEIRLTKEMRRR